jgi:hypothetical protein
VNESQADPNDLLAELRKAKPEELIVHSASLFASLAYGKLAPETRDLEQARVSIEALKALVGVLPEELRRDFGAVVANLQLAYADAAAPTNDTAE